MSRKGDAYFCVMVLSYLILLAIFHSETAILVTIMIQTLFGFTLIIDSLEEIKEKRYREEDVLEG